MKNKFEKTILSSLFVAGLLFFFPLIRKKPSKEMNDWLLVFFIKSYISSILDTIINKKGYVKYPVNLGKNFNISVLFSYLLFPLACIYFNQVTKNSSLTGTLVKVIFLGGPMALIESWLEKNTKIIKYGRGWNSFTSFVSISFTFLFVRGIMSIIRKLNNSTS